MNKRIAVRRMQRARRVGAAMLAAAGLAMAAGAARAQTWNLHTIIDPPVLPDVNPSDLMGFGTAVSVGSTSWLVVGAPKADCANAAGPGVIADAGRIFIYRRVSGVWNYHQSFCAGSPVNGARYGSSLDMSQGWMIVGAPSGAGAVEMFYLNSATQQWSRQLTVNGVADGLLGQSVSIDRGLAVAGEPGYDGQRGRIRSWKLSGAFAIAQPHYAPAGLAAADRYGWRVAVQSNGCELPQCTSFTDVVAALASSRLYIAKRNTSGWVSSQSIVPPPGASFRFPGALDVSAYQVVVAINIATASPSIGCPAGQAVRVFDRDGGGYFTLTGDACPTPSNIAGTFGAAVAADRGTSQFYVASTDNNAQLGSPQPATVSTYAGFPAITYLDSVQELSLAPNGPAPDFYNDDFGASISEYSSYMAVGAPWRHAYLGWPGIGYVAVYKSCC